MTSARTSAVYLAYCSAFTREFEDWDSVLPPGDAPFTERLAGGSAHAWGSSSSARETSAGGPAAGAGRG